MRKLIAQPGPSPFSQIEMTVTTSEFTVWWGIHAADKLIASGVVDSKSPAQLRRLATQMEDQLKAVTQKAGAE